MRSQCLNVAAATAIVFVTGSAAKSQSLVIQKDWDLLTSMSSSGPIYQQGLIVKFDTPIPWRIDWNSSPSPWAVPYGVSVVRDGIPDGIDSGYVPGNSSGTKTYGTLTELADNIELGAAAFHPQYFPQPTDRHGTGFRDIGN